MSLEGHKDYHQARRRPHFTSFCSFCTAAVSLGCTRVSVAAAPLEGRALRTTTRQGAAPFFPLSCLFLHCCCG